MNRWIVIPDDVPMENENGELSNKVSNFVKWIRDDRLVDLKFGATTELLYYGKSMRAKFLGKEPGQSVELSNEEWVVLVAIVQAPTDPYNPAAAYQIDSFFSAVFRADTNCPEDVAAVA